MSLSQAFCNYNMFAHSGANDYDIGANDYNRG